jgi:hypoxanthine phosphoribosyltransferase
MSAIPADAIRETWDDVHAKSLKLAEMIKEGGEKFDAIVVVPRGGYFPAVIVARRLGFGAADMLQASIGSYEDDAAERESKFRIGQMPSDEEVKGKKLLVIDEVCDTGSTLDFLAKRLREQGAAAVRTGVLHSKPGRSVTGFTPDWSVITTDKWVVYPWEDGETT